MLWTLLSSSTSSLIGAFRTVVETVELIRAARSVEVRFALPTSFHIYVVHLTHSSLHVC